MSNLLKITNIEKKENKIVVSFMAEGDWLEYLKKTQTENIYDENIEKVPDGIAVIPTLCNLLPIAWVYNFEIEVDEIDKKFYEAIPKILDGYKKMYPKLSFGGKIKANKIIEHKYNVKKTGVLFSGGVDATTTAYRRMDEKPDIITVIGSDIKLTDEKGIKMVNTLNANFAKEHRLDYKKIFSDFREFLDECKLGGKEELLKNKYAWWHEFQHGIGLIGLVAPLSYVRGYKTVYIASSYHESQWGQYVCASDPVIDNELKYGKTNTFHDGYELTRQDKIKFICDFANKNKLKPHLRVCWESSGGKNCCHCEKCRRTYLAILAEKYNPSDYGLDFSKKQYKQMAVYYKKHLGFNFNKTVLPLYEAIRSAFVKNYSYDETPEELKWFRTIEIGKKNLPLITRFIDNMTLKKKMIIRKMKEIL